jgi:DNA-binding response OmpR family regulator/nitrogen-specific signal transduction histidine kinase
VEQRNQLHSQAGRLQALDALKSHFFTNISHEFRTPLTVILGHIDLMTRGKTSDTTLPIMKRNAQRLLQLISQLLDLSKLEAGAMTLRASRTDIVRFARRVVAAFGSYAGHKGITLTFNGRANPHADGQPAVFVYVDTDKMDKVLNNLLSNALKFTPHGGAVDVIITSGVLDDNTGGDTVEIMVKDTGPGIPREKIPFVFDRFYQVQDYAKPGVEGTGVGLALVKELVELHHGSVRVRSEVGSGSEFSIRIPTGIAHLDEGEIVEPEPEEFAPPVMPDDVSEVAAPSPTEYPPDATVLLLVEDNADLRSFMRDRLAEEYAILEADNGTTGFTMADTHLPDLIISDIMMPGIDGIALCAAIKSTAKTNHIPVILLTAKATIENKMEGLETGADDYLTKPFNADELALRVRNIIAMRRTLQEKFSNALLLQPSAIEVPSRQKEFLAQVMASIERHMSDEEFGVETLASDVAMSRAQLHRKLKALTNQSPNELIRSFRLHRAADLIVQDAGSLSEIAYQVGFSSQAYFTKCFVEKFHCTPSEYRKQAPSPPVT